MSTANAEEVPLWAAAVEMLAPKAAHPPPAPAGTGMGFGCGKTPVSKPGSTSMFWAGAVEVVRATTAARQIALWRGKSVAFIWVKQN